LGKSTDLDERGVGLAFHEPDVFPEPEITDCADGVGDALRTGVDAVYLDKSSSPFSVSETIAIGLRIELSRVSNQSLSKGESSEVPSSMNRRQFSSSSPAAILRELIRGLKCSKAIDPTFFEPGSWGSDCNSPLSSDSHGLRGAWNASASGAPLGIRTISGNAGPILDDAIRNLSLWQSSGRMVLDIS